MMVVAGSLLLVDDGGDASNPRMHDAGSGSVERGEGLVISCCVDVNSESHQFCKITAWSLTLIVSV